MRTPRTCCLSAAAFLSLVGCAQIIGLEEGEPNPGANGGAGGGSHEIPCPNGVADCPGPAHPECGSARCEAGICGLDFVADGTPLAAAAQTEGDCKTLVCNGAGETRVESDDDPKSDGNPCTDDVCTDGSTSNLPLSGMVVCYTGPADTLGVAPCKSGMQQCNAGMKTGDCIGEVTPQTEDCDAARVDENCNGEVNESGASCVCKPDMTYSCYGGPPAAAGVGMCSLGTWTCNPDGLAFDGNCIGYVLPAAEEACDGGIAKQDENCDGATDDVCACTPNEIETCMYNGPAGTLGIGVCVAPTKTCDATGKAYLAECAGEVVPSYDSCDTPEDEDCNGANLACTGQWILPLPDLGLTTPTRVLSIGVDVVVLTNGNNTQLVLRKVQPNKTISWTKTYSPTGPGGIRPHGMTRDSAGNILVTGMFNGSANFGGSNFTTQFDGQYYNEAIFVAKYDASGNHMWSKMFDIGSPDSFTGNNGYGIATDGANNVYVAGRLSSEVPINFGGGPLAPAAACNSPGLGIDGFLLKLSAAGTHIYSKRIDYLAVCGSSYFQDVAVDAAGNAYVSQTQGPLQKFDAAGNPSSTFPASGGEHTVAVTSTGEVVTAYNGNVVRYAANGGVLWSTPCGSPVRQLRLEGTGTVWALCDTIIKRFDAAGTVTFWEQLVYGQGNHNSYDIGVDTMGDVYVLGKQNSTNALTLGGYTQTNAGPTFLAKMAP